MFWKRLLTVMKLLAIGLVLIVLIGPEWPAFQDERFKINSILGQRYFDFVTWEANALAAKGDAILAGGQNFLSNDTQQSIVTDYLSLIFQIRALEAEVNVIYADPEIGDPDEASRQQQDEIDKKRAEMADIQPVAESILQDQVASVLIDEGFDLVGGAWPPVQMHMTPLPKLLVVSPREEIRQIYSISLEHGLTSESQESIESSVLEEVDRSALVVPIGGIGFFPAMIVESSNINFLTNTIAHEWAHHWLTLHPLGIRYAANPELRTMNETVASILGDAVGAKVIERYYPEFIPPTEEDSGDPPEPNPNDPPPFDFSAEMAQTRRRTDELLAEGHVDEAEIYMETRRQFFWDNGYRIRKLNQAFFAFYGAYADTPGEQGEDPIGPMIVAIRESSSDLREFMDRMGSVTSLESLQAEAGSAIQG